MMVVSRRKSDVMDLVAWKRAQPASHTSSMSLDFLVLPPAIASAAHVIKNALAASLQISTSFDLC
jgi:hypothetical protein